jgi:endoglucanase
MIDLIEKLTQAWGPSGYEHHVRKLIEAEVAPYVDEMRVDGMGNLICRIGSGGTRVIIGAHMDEIGVMATFREPSSGMLRFADIGGLQTRALIGRRVQFEDGTIGVIGAPSGWSSMTALKLDDLYIDTGGVMVEPGQPAGFVNPLVAQGDAVISKALDDRIGCVVLIEAIKRLNKSTPNEVYAVFTTQEEVGLRGAGAAAYGVDPQVGFAIDVTATGDVPQGPRMQVKLGGGAAIKIHDPGLVVPKEVIDWMTARAETDGIPYQREVLAGGTTDAARFQNVRAGVPSGCISIPCRYVHTPSEMAYTSDIEACVRLTHGLLANPAPF